MASNEILCETFRRRGGVFQLIPIFIPRRFSTAGRRLRLHPDDYFALGTARGSIKERWFSSVIAAMNGPLAPPDEGMSKCVPANGRAEDVFTLKVAVETLGAELIGEELMQQHGTWPMYSKFFDFGAPLFHHLHLSFEAAARVGRLGKPEAYFFPPQLNNHLGQFPVTYFGFDPSVSREQVRERLAAYEAGDNRITELSRGFRIELGTGWYTPPGVVHAPGSVLTYEPQWNSDVNSVYENMVGNEIYPYEFLVENCPPDQKRDLDYVLGLMDWEKNIDPFYKDHFFRPPLPAANGDGWREEWITYGNEYIAAKQLTIEPGREVVVTDPVAYGCILIQSHGRFGAYAAETAGMLRYGQWSADEYFVSAEAAQRGVTIANHSAHEPMVILKHFPSHGGVPAGSQEGVAR